MSGDCGHGWGYHYDGASGPCYKCLELKKSTPVLMAEELKEIALTLNDVRLHNTHTIVELIQELQLWRALAKAHKLRLK